MGLAVIVALVVANMILIPLAIRHAQGSGDRGTRPETSPRQEGPQSSRSPEAQRDPLLMSSGGRIILSSTRGSCRDRTQTTVRLSRDRGQTFRTLKLNPRPSAVLALEVVGGDSMLVIGADDRNGLTAGCLLRR